MKILDKEIAEAIGKTPSSISYIKRTNPKEYDILRAGVIVKKYGMTEHDIRFANELIGKVKRGG